MLPRAQFLIFWAASLPPAAVMVDSIAEPYALKRCKKGSVDRTGPRTARPPRPERQGTNQAKRGGIHKKSSGVKCTFAKAKIEIEIRLHTKWQGTRISWTQTSTYNGQHAFYGHKPVYKMDGAARILWTQTIS